MLSDKATIFVQGGRGGDGVASFRREAHVPKGGPDGGDGGHGGSVVLVCDDSLRDLQSFKRRMHYKADRGRHGEGAKKHGASGQTLEIKVPPGTHVTLQDGTTHDLVVPGQRATIARGGSGGRGNPHFASATRQAPRFRERGIDGEEQTVHLQLKLLADVGLIGLPNAGKSSLLSRMTRAAPKVADYPFTTLEPVLGTLDGEDRQLVIADIPGLIEGAAEGHGLGHDFLAHVERTRLLVHVLELLPLDGSDPEENFDTIEAELSSYDHRLTTLPRIIVLSKADLMSPEDGEAMVELWRERFPVPQVEEWEEEPASTPILLTSSATGQGLELLKAELLRRVPVQGSGVPALGAAEDLAEHQVFRPADKRAWRVERRGPGDFLITGAPVERLLARFDLDNEEALQHIEQRLRKMGVVDALNAQGFEPGDDVEIDGVVFELE